MDNEEFIQKFEELVLPNLVIKYLPEDNWYHASIQLLYKDEVISESLVIE